MKRVVIVILCLLMVTSLLCACGKDVGEKTFTYKNISMTIPDNYEDMSEEEDAEYLDFAVGKGVNIVMGTKVYGFTAEDYVKYSDFGSEISKDFEERNGYIYFQYKYSEKGIDYLYDVGLFDDNGDLWIIQVSSLEEHYSKKQDTILAILDSVTVD